MSEIAAPPAAAPAIAATPVDATPPLFYRPSDLFRGTPVDNSAIVCCGLGCNHLRYWKGDEGSNVGCAGDHQFCCYRSTYCCMEGSESYPWSMKCGHGKVKENNPAMQRYCCLTSGPCCLAGLSRGDILCTMRDQCCCFEHRCAFPFTEQEPCNCGLCGAMCYVFETGQGGWKAGCFSSLNDARAHAPVLQSISRDDKLVQEERDATNAPTFAVVSESSPANDEMHTVIVE
jgi:hypothetical protein